MFDTNFVLVSFVLSPFTSKHFSMWQVIEQDQSIKFKCLISSFNHTEICLLIQYRFVHGAWI